MSTRYCGSQLQEGLQKHLGGSNFKKAEKILLNVWGMTPTEEKLVNNAYVVVSIYVP